MGIVRVVCACELELIFPTVTQAYFKLNDEFKIADEQFSTFEQMHFLLQSMDIGARGKNPSGCECCKQKDGFEQYSIMCKLYLKYLQTIRNTISKLWLCTT